MSDSDHSDAVLGGQVDEPTVEPTVRELLLPASTNTVGCSASSSTR